MAEMRVVFGYTEYGRCTGRRITDPDGGSYMEMTPTRTFDRNGVCVKEEPFEPVVKMYGRVGLAGLMSRIVVRLKPMR